MSCWSWSSLAMLKALRVARADAEAEIVPAVVPDQRLVPHDHAALGLGRRACTVTSGRGGPPRRARTRSPSRRSSIFVLTELPSLFVPTTTFVPATKQTKGLGTPRAAQHRSGSAPVATLFIKVLPSRHTSRAYRAWGGEHSCNGPRDAGPRQRMLEEERAGRPAADPDRRLVHGRHDCGGLRRRPGVTAVQPDGRIARRGGEPPPGRVGDGLGPRVRQQHVADRHDDVPLVRPPRGQESGRADHADAPPRWR